MPTFDAGSIESRLTLDRSDFNRELDQAQADGERFESRSYTASADLNTAAANAALDRLQARLDSLGGGTTSVRTSGVDSALTQLTALQAAADRLDGRDINMRIQLIGQAAAASQLTALDVLASRIDGRNVNINARTSTSSATSDLDQLASKLASASSAVPLLVAAVAGLGPALVPIGIAAAGAGAGIVSMVAAGGGALGAFAGATLGAVKATQDHSKALTVTNAALAQAQSAYSSAASAATAQGAAVTQARQQVVTAEQAVGTAVQQAAQQTQSARDAAVTADQAVGKAAQQAAQQVQQARDAVVAAKAAEAKAATTAAQQIQTAKDQVVSAQQAESKAATTSAQQIASARQTLANAQQAVGVAAQNSAQQVQNAKDAVVAAIQQQDQAVQQVGNAELQLANAQRSERDAQLALTQARVDAKRTLQDMNESLKDAQLSETGAKLAVEQAQQSLNQVNAAGSAATELQREQAQLAFDEAKQHLEEQGIATQRLQADTAAANHAGVDGAKTVTAANRSVQQSQQGIATAQQGLANAQQSAANASRATAKAQEQVTQAQASGARSYAQAQQTAANASTALKNAQVNGAASVVAAQQAVAKAQQNVAYAESNGAATVAAAQAATAKAVKAVTTAQVAGQQQIATAQQAAAKAEANVAVVRAQGDRQVAQAKQGVIAAQQGLATAQNAAARSAQAAAVAAAALAAAQNKQSLAAKAFTPIERALSGSLGNLKTAWGSFIGSTEKQTLSPVITVVNALAAALPHLTPLVRAVAPVVQEVANAFAHWVNGQGLDRAVNFMQTNGVPILRSFAGVGRSLLGVVGDLVRAFGPFGVAIAGNLAKGATALKGWSDGGGFTRFVTTVRSYAPQVEHFLSILGGALGQVGRAAKANGPLMLGMVTIFLQLIAHTPVPVLQAILLALVLYRPAMLLAAAATWLFADSQIAARNGLVTSRIAAAAMVVWAGITRAATLTWAAAQWILNSALLASPITWIVLGIAAVVAAIVLIATRTRWFQNIWNVVWGGIKLVAGAVWGWLQSNWKTLVEVMIILMTGGMATIPLLFYRYWSNVKQIAGTIWGWLENAFHSTVNFFTTLWGHALGWLDSVWHSTWNGIHNVGTAVWNSITGAFHAFTDFFSNLWHTTADGWNSVWHNTWNAIHDIGKRVWGDIETFFTGKWSWLLGKFSSVFLNPMKSAFSTALNDIKTTADTIWGKIQTAFKTPINVVIGFYNNGIASIGNDILKAFGIKGNPIPKINKLADGGALHGGVPGVDSIPVLGMQGEHMLNVADVKAMGGQQNVYKFRQALHMADGGAIGSNLPTTGVVNPYITAPASVNNIKPKKDPGLFGSVGNFFSSVGGLAEKGLSTLGGAGLKLVGGALKLIHPLIAGAVGLVANPVINALEHTVSGTIGKVGGVGSALATGINQGVLDKVKDWISGKDGAANANTSGMYSSAGPKVQYGGVTLDTITLKQLKKAFGYAGGSFGLSQGSFSTGVAASAGTHSGGGALDVAGVGGMSIVRQIAVVKALREAGFAAWRRTQSEGFADHIHAELIGDPLASAQAQAQWPDYFAHKDGLAGHKKDDNPIDVAAGWFGSSAPNSGNINFSPSAGVNQWLPQIKAALKLAGLPNTFVGQVERQMSTESSGNPNAVNTTDINAQHGDPSQGLMQVIGSTFNRYAGSLKSKGIRDPEANIYAAIKYAQATYGPTMMRGGNGLGSGHAYANGTSGAAPGWAQVGERGMEWIYMHGGETVLPHGLSPSGVGGRAPGYATGTPVTISGLPGTAQQTRDTQVEQAAQKKADTLRAQYEQQRLRTAQETNKYRKAADQAELNVLSARLSAANSALSQAKSVQTADTRAMTAAAKAAQTSADAVTKNLRTWVDQQLASLKAQLAAADQLRQGYLSGAQGAVTLSATSPNAPSTLGASYSAATRQISQLTGNVQRLSALGLSPGLQGDILAMSPGDALTYSSALLRQAGGGSIAHLNSQYNQFQAAANTFANISANSVSGLNGVQAAYNELAGATVRVDVHQPKTMILSIDGKQFRAEVAATVETEVTSILTKAKNSKG